MQISHTHHMAERAYVRPLRRLKGLALAMSMCVHGENDDTSISKPLEHCMFETATASGPVAEESIYSVANHLTLFKA